MHYPSYRYHATLRPVIAQDPDHDDALAADGYRDTPAAFIDHGFLGPDDDETLNAPDAADAPDAAETWQPPAGMDEAREETPAPVAAAKPKRKR